MKLFAEPVRIRQQSLEFLAERQGLHLPTTLRPEPYHYTPDERTALYEQVHGELRELGLLDRGAPAVELVIAVRALGAADVELYASLINATGSWRVHVAAHGRDAVFARHVTGSEDVLLRNADADNMVTELVGELGGCPPAPDQAITCRFAELFPEEPTIAVERRFTRAAKRMRQLHDRQIRLAEAALYVSARADDGQPQTRQLNVLEVQPGVRWLTNVTGEGDNRHLNARGAGTATIADALTTELATLTGHR